MKDMFGKAVDGIAPFNQLEEIARQNVAMFEKAVQTMFNPFGSMFAGKEKEEEAD